MCAAACTTFAVVLLLMDEWIDGCERYVFICMCVWESVLVSGECVSRMIQCVRAYFVYAGMRIFVYKKSCGRTSKCVLYRNQQCEKSRTHFT